MGFQEKEAKKEHPGRKRDTSDITNVITNSNPGGAVGQSRESPKLVSKGERRWRKTQEGRRAPGGGIRWPCVRGRPAGVGVAREERKGDSNREKPQNRRTEGQGSRLAPEGRTVEVNPQ